MQPEVMEEKPVVDENPAVEEDVSVPETKKEDEIKESVDEYQKDERFELEDSEVEYEHEEYVGEDYDLKEIDQEDAHELGDEVEENHEEVNEGQEDEGDMVGEEIEDDPEELEGEGSEEDEHVHEHPKMIDVDEEEHREVLKERRKLKEFEVFVGGLDMDATEDDLRKAFSEIGEVTEVRLMMNTQTKKNKGFAFLRFATVEQAKRAVTTLPNPVINGKQCGVTPSTKQDSDTLFLSNICKTWRKEALEEKLKHYGVENVVDLTLVEDRNSEGMNRGFAFVEFSSRSDAMAVYKCLQNRDIEFGDDRPAKVSFADSFSDPDDEIMAQVKTLFVDGIPALWDEDRVRELLKKYGEIEKIELSRNMPLAKRKDFGFVTFDSHDAAVTCAKSINNAELGEGDSKAKVSARLSRPLQRVQGKHINYVDYRSGRRVGPVGRGSWDRPAPHRFPVRGVRGRGRHIPLPPVRMKRPFGLRERRPAMSMPPKKRPLAPLPSYGRRAPVPPYPKSSFKRENGWRDDVVPPRNRPVADYGSRLVSGRWQSNRDEYSFHASAYSDMHRIPSQTAPRRAYANDSYGRRFERPPPSYQEPRSRDYDSTSGSKRPYAALDDVPPRYADAGIRQSRTHLDYRYARGPSQYGDSNSYGDRFGRSNVGYGSGRSSTFNHYSHGRNSSSHQGMGYGRGSFGGSDVSSMYSSSYGGDYISRGSDVGGTGSSYSSWYPNRDVGGNSYMGTGSSRSYY